MGLWIAPLLVYRVYLLGPAFGSTWHLSRSDLVIFKGDLNHRKLTYDCATPASTPFDVAIGSMANAVGAPRVASLRTIKSDVVVGLGSEEDEVAEKLDQVEPGWKISGKYVRQLH